MSTEIYEAINRNRKYCQHCGFIPKKHEREQVLECYWLGAYFCDKCHELMHLAFGLKY